MGQTDGCPNNAAVFTNSSISHDIIMHYLGEFVQHIEASCQRLIEMSPLFLSQVQPAPVFLKLVFMEKRWYPFDVKRKTAELA
jgi:hypothetical protein